MKKYKINTLTRTKNGLKAIFNGSTDNYAEAFEHVERMNKGFLGGSSVGISITNTETSQVEYYYKK